MALAHDRRMAPARVPLTGLPVGDAFGDQFFLLHNRAVSATSGLPPAPWKWSDGTQTACSIIDVLNRRHRIDRADLVRYFRGAVRRQAPPRRRSTGSAGPAPARCPLAPGPAKSSPTPSTLSAQRRTV